MNWYFKCQERFTVMEDYKARFILKPSYPEKSSRTVDRSRRLSRLKKLFDTGEPVHTWNILQKLQICYLHKQTNVRCSFTGLKTTVFPT